MAHLQFVDVSIREYLLFRGFSATLKAFESESRSAEKSFSVDKIMDRITHSIATQDLNSLRDLWRNLTHFFFNKLDQLHGAAVKRIEANMLKLFLVSAHAANKPDKVHEFFLKCPELQSQSEWKDWFGETQETPKTKGKSLNPPSFSLSLLQSTRGAPRVQRLLLQAVAGHAHDLPAQLPRHHIPVHAHAHLGPNRFRGYFDQQIAGGESGTPRADRDAAVDRRLTLGPIYLLIHVVASVPVLHLQ